ncbi:MAG: minichromosome maintenance protein MCM [Candidatus Micrarchaeota archaeon]|nr:minichromosome maintenance protein MCM [Candidatus Micrarchaeota archaeon]
MASDVDISPYVEKFEQFYSDALSEKINSLLSNYPAQKSILVDYAELERYDAALADILIKQPDLILPAAESALVSAHEITYKTAHPESSFEPHVRFFNLPDSGILIQDMSSRQIREMISVKGVITKRTEVRHKVKVAVYTCQLCDAKMKVPLTQTAAVPQVCDSCKRRALKLEESESYFVDMQWAQAQDLLERLHGGVTPTQIDLLIEDDLVNTIIPGDTVEITGIMRIRPISPKGKGKGDSAYVYESYLDVVYVRRMQRDFEELEISKDEERLILEYSKNPQIYEMMRNSIAPGIYGHDEVKDALVLQLFGGTPGKFMPGNVPIRDDMHILLIGDPGSAKTRLLEYVCRIAPKSIYVSGKSSTGAGLTAVAEKDERGDGGWVLKAGALVIASGGLAGVDEFDKIEDNERAALHEVMESQKISIAKAGIVATFKAKTAILAAANPKFGRFDPKELIAKQFDIPPTILSRFDLVFPIIDVLDEEKDSQLAKHLLSIHQSAAKFGQGEIAEEEKRAKPTLSLELFRKYISYARLHVKPVLSEDAMERLKGFYVQLRKQSEGGAVAITPRYIEGLVRLSEASAKVRLSPVVDGSDAERAIRLVSYMLDKVSRDKETGRLDIDILMTGRPKSQVDKIYVILSLVEKIQKELGAVGIEYLIEKAAEENIERSLAKRLISELISKGELYEFRPGVVKLVGQKPQ